MAASFVTLPKPFVLSSPPLKNSLPGFRRNGLRINAVAQKWEPSKVVPQADRVLIRLEELPQKSAGGVLLPKSAVKFERYLMGEVLSVGAEVGGVEAGKKVLFSDISAYEVTVLLQNKTSIPMRVLDKPGIDEVPYYIPYYLPGESKKKKKPISWCFWPVVELGTDAKHCFCKAGDLLAVVE